MSRRVYVIEARSRRGKNWFPSGSVLHAKRKAEQVAQGLRDTGSVLLYRVTKYVPGPVNETKGEA